MALGKIQVTLRGKNNFTFPVMLANRKVLRVILINKGFIKKIQ